MRLTVELDYLNAQGQPTYVWPASFVLARAYVDQMERTGELTRDMIAEVRTQLTAAERASGRARTNALEDLADNLSSDVPRTAKVRMLTDVVNDLAGM